MSHVIDWSLISFMTPTQVFTWYIEQIGLDTPRDKAIQTWIATETISADMIPYYLGLISDKMFSLYMFRFGHNYLRDIVDELTDRNLLCPELSAKIAERQQSIDIFKTVYNEVIDIVYNGQYPDGRQLTDRFGRIEAQYYSIFTSVDWTQEFPTISCHYPTHPMLHIFMTLAYASDNEIFARYCRTELIEAVKFDTPAHRTIFWEKLHLFFRWIAGNNWSIDRKLAAFEQMLQQIQDQMKFPFVQTIMSFTHLHSERQFVEFMIAIMRPAAPQQQPIIGPTYIMPTASVLLQASTMADTKSA